jgi:hypothetical protein
MAISEARIENDNSFGSMSPWFEDQMSSANTHDTNYGSPPSPILTESPSGVNELMPEWKRVAMQNFPENITTMFSNSLFARNGQVLEMWLATLPEMLSLDTSTDTYGHFVLVADRHSFWCFLLGARYRVY